MLAMCIFIDLVAVAKQGDNISYILYLRVAPTETVSVSPERRNQPSTFKLNMAITSS